ncbi:MAG: Uma2 family endonuclease [Verrucomicrobiales bacterium]|nr:Uma2 family endonuclease [Verrucomicrobiales bacterium]
MSAAAAEEDLSEAEFLERERRAELKSEFFRGEIFAMAGGTREHSLIAMNLGGELRSQLKSKPCLTYNADLRVKIEATGLLTYPDISVVCGAERFLDEERDTLLNPTLLGEVLSDSTEAYDRGTKFSHYRLIPSLRHVLFVSQKEPRVECYSRIGEEWRLSEALRIDAKLALPALEITIALSEVFSKVEFGSRAPRLHP